MPWCWAPLMRSLARVLMSQSVLTESTTPRALAMAHLLAAFNRAPVRTAGTPTAPSLMENLRVQQALSFHPPGPMPSTRQQGGKIMAAIATPTTLLTPTLRDRRARTASTPFPRRHSLQPKNAGAFWLVLVEQLARRMNFVS